LEKSDFLSIFPEDLGGGVYYETSCSHPKIVFLICSENIMGNTTFLTNCSAWLYSDPSQDTHPAPKAPEDTTPIEPTTETPKPSKPKYDFSTFQMQKIKRVAKSNFFFFFFLIFLLVLK
jgi:hypothetical protein